MVGTATGAHRPNKRGNIALNTGLELPLNDHDRYDWRAYVYFIWDFADGGLFEGW
jgi:hypothetical protein